MDMKEELRKLKAAVAYGADSVMDLSLGCSLNTIRKKIIKASPVMIGTVPIYQTAYDLSRKKKDITDMDYQRFS